MRILVIGDLEGKFPKGLNKKFIAKNKIDFIISSGDFGDGRELTKLVFKHWGKSLEKAIGIKKFNAVLKNEYNSGIKIIKKLNMLGIPIYTIFGNHDYNESGSMGFDGKYEIPKNYKSYGKIINSLKNIKYMNKKKIKINDNNFIFHDDNIKFINSQRYLRGGYSRSEKAETDLVRKNYIENISKLMKSEKNNILITHRPPYETKLDEIRNAKSPRNGEHVGDVPTKYIIEKYQPILHICGHMHENQGKCKIGKTLVVNAGFGQIGQVAIIDLPQLKIKFIKL